jgi:uncharacterized protein
MKRHNLIDEFPEHKDKIHDLKMNDHHFRKLFDEYDEVDAEIHRIESGAEATIDDVLNDLRKKRVHLKDELSAILAS